jgi:hypothetical protein
MGNITETELQRIQLIKKDSIEVASTLGELEYQKITIELLVEEEKKKIGWKDKREVRIEIYKQALAELEENFVDIHLKQLAKEQAKATKAYLKGYFGATERQDKDSAGKIEVKRAGFTPNYGHRTTRDSEVREMEEALIKRFEAEMTDEEREQRELLKETEEAERKARKSGFK